MEAIQILQQVVLWGLIIGIGGIIITIILKFVWDRLPQEIKDKILKKDKR